MAKTSGGLRGDKNVVAKSVQPEIVQPSEPAKKSITAIRSEELSRRAARQNLKTAPKDYKEGGYSVVTKNGATFRDNVDKLADVRPMQAATVTYMSTGRETIVERRGSLYTVTNATIDSKGNRKEKREFVSKERFEANKREYL